MTKLISNELNSDDMTGICLPSQVGMSAILHAENLKAMVELETTEKFFPTGKMFVVRSFGWVKKLIPIASRKSKIL